MEYKSVTMREKIGADVARMLHLRALREQRLRLIRARHDRMLAAGFVTTDDDEPDEDDGPAPGDLRVEGIDDDARTDRG